MKKWYRSAIKILLILFGLVVGFWYHYKFAVNQYLNVDELSSIFYSQNNSYLDMLQRNVEATHPNLFYFFIKFLLELLPIVDLRVIMWGIFLLSTFVVYKIYRRLELNWFEAGMASIFWVFSAKILELTFMVRMYGLGVLIMLISLLFFLLYQQKKGLRKKIYLWLVLIINMVGFSVVFGYVCIVIIEFIWLAYRKKRAKYFLLIELLVMCLYLVEEILIRGGEIKGLLFWVETTNLQTFYLFVVKVLGIGVFHSLFIVIILFCLGGVIYRSRQKDLGMMVYISFLVLEGSFLGAVIFLPYMFHEMQLFAPVIVFLIGVIGILVVSLRDRNKFYFGAFLYLVLLLSNVVQFNRKLEDRRGNKYDEVMDTSFVFKEMNINKYFLEEDYSFMYYYCGRLGTKIENLAECKSKGFLPINNYEMIKNFNGKFILRLPDYKVGLFDKYRGDYRNNIHCLEYDSYLSLYICNN